MSRTIPDPGFAGDDGSTSAPLARALQVYEQDPEGGYLPVLSALSQSRLLVPVIAVLGEQEKSESTGLAQEKSSDMATVLIQRPDGRRGLLAFSSMQTLACWNPEGRPVPVSAATAALSAVQEEAVALVVDVAGPAQFVVQGEEMAALARGWRLLSLGEGEWGWALTEAVDGS